MDAEGLRAALAPYGAKVATAAEAVRQIKPGAQVFIGTACATPRELVAALEAIPYPPADITMLHFIITDAVPHDGDGRPLTKFRHRCYFVDSAIRASVKQGLAEYVPISIPHLPRMIELGRIPVDVALIQVSPPDEFGYVSLGISVDVLQAVVAHARYVVAEVNPQMPRTMGDSTLHVDEIDRLVPVDTPVIEYRHTAAREETVERIVRYIAGIIDDGSTLHIGLGRIPNEALKYLDDRKDLGIHSDVITDTIIPLLEKGILTGRQKSQQRGKIVASFALGTRRLYDLIDRNPLFSFHPIDFVCHPNTVAAQSRMVSVTQAFALDLTGQVCADQFGGEFYSGVAAQGEFLRGAARSTGGKPIICLTATTDDGETSRIRPLLLAGEGVTISRNDVHYVITEYGIDYLFGKSIRERAVALIGIAHPKFRPWLLEEAQKLGYVGAEQTMKNLKAYPVEEERWASLKNGKSVLLRPATAADAEGIRNLFYCLPEDDVYTRFFRRVRGLSSAEIERLCNLDYETAVAFVAVLGTRENEQIVGHASYFTNLSTNLAETAFMVHPQWQGTGLGTVMQRRLMEHAVARGLRGFVAEILPENRKMMKLARSCCDNVSVEKDEDSVHVTMLFA